MKKPALWVLAASVFVSCQKEAKKFEGTYQYVSVQSAMCDLPDTSYTNDKNYIITIERESANKIVISNLDNSDRAVEAEVDGDVLNINSSSFGGDPYVSVQGSGSLKDNQLTLNYKVITPDCNITGNGIATK